MADRQHIHLIGIGGTGLSAIARVLLEQGYQVSGSDRALSRLAKDLSAAGVQVFSGHRAENVLGADLVVRSSAVPDDNVEVKAARDAGTPVLKRAEFLKLLLDDKRIFAVAGTAGKTTTTAMVAWLLARIGEDPSYIIGGTSKNLGGNAHAGQGGAFVIEADEYDRMFLGLEPNVVIITNLEYDHPDCFKTMDDYVDAFKEFVWQMRSAGHLLLSHDDPMVHLLSNFVPQDVNVRTFGLDPEATYTARNMQRNENGAFDYDAFYQDGSGTMLKLEHVSLLVPGEFNARNSLAALAVAHQFHPDKITQAAQALSEFTGTGRRFDVLGTVGGITVIDDYAHHPAKISAALSAARMRYPQARIWAVWQPHTYSRTIELADAFAKSFNDADRVLVTEVYPAREKAADFDQYSAARIAGQIEHPAVQFTPTLEDALQALLRQLQPGDVVIVLSAGDADQVSVQVLETLRHRSLDNQGAGHAR